MKRGKSKAFITIQVIFITLFFFSGTGFIQRISKRQSWSFTHVEDGFTMKRDTEKQRVTNSTISMISEEKTQFITEKPLQKSGMNTINLLVVTGAVISILLLIIVIQLCKSQSTKRKSFIQQKGNREESSDKSSARPDNKEDKQYKTISSSQQLKHLYQHVDVVYEDIDENVDITLNPDHSKAANSIESYKGPTEFYDLSSVEERKYDSRAHSSDLYLLPSNKRNCSDTNNSDEYLQPVFVLEDKKHEDNEAHLYIDVTE